MPAAATSPWARRHCRRAQQLAALHGQAAYQRPADLLRRPPTPQNHPAMTVQAFIDTWKAGGYGVALVAPDGTIYAPYVDCSDYPGLAQQPATTWIGDAQVAGGELDGFRLVLHSGQLELDYYSQQPYKAAS